jgi:hypothetical protein
MGFPQGLCRVSDFFVFLSFSKALLIREFLTSQRFPHTTRIFPISKPTEHLRQIKNDRDYDLSLFLPSVLIIRD